MNERMPRRPLHQNETRALHTPWLVLAAALLSLVATACGGGPERPQMQEASGLASPHMSGPQTSEQQSSTESCEHGTVVECKIWVTDVDCFSGVAVCDHGTLSACLDADSAEALLDEVDRSVE